MGLRINTNIPVLAAQRTLEQTTADQEKTLNRLSSGQRIVNSGDDAAGLAIGSKLNAQIRGFNMAKRSANDGVSLMQTAEGAMNEVSNMLIRMRELGVQAASDTIGSEERAFLNIETQQLKSEIDRIAQTTQFNGVKLLTGDNESDFLQFQVGANAGEENRIQYNVNAVTATTESLEIGEVDMLERDDAVESLGSLDQAIYKINEHRAGLGAMQNRLVSSSNNLSNMVEQFSAAKSRIMDADFAQETASLVRSNILTNAGVAVLGQASNRPSQALKLL